MKTINYLGQLKENRTNKVKRICNWIIIITLPLTYLLVFYLFNRFIGKIKITSVYLMYSLLGLLLIGLIVKARELGRYLTEIEQLLLKEAETRIPKADNSFKTWGEYKRPFKSLIILLLFIIASGPSIAKIYPFYYEKAYFLVPITYIFLSGLFMLKTYRKYLNGLISFYTSMSTSAGIQVKETWFMAFNRQRIISNTFILGMVYFIICRFILSDITTYDILMLVFPFCVVFILGNSLHEAFKGLYKALSEIDHLRNSFDKSQVYDEK